MCPDPYTIRITLTSRPDPDQYAAAVLGIQAVLAMVGLHELATVHQDPTLVSDAELGVLSDRWGATSPWDDHRRYVELMCRMEN